MKLRTLTPPTGLYLCVTLLASCSPGAGSSGVPSGSASALSAVPATEHAARGIARRSGVRTMSVPVCSVNGSHAFVGGNDGNVAGGEDSGVLSGGNNQACDAVSGIGAGGGNAISSAADTANYSFIGAGDLNTITGSGFESFLGSGASNVISGSGDQSFLGSGYRNTITGTGGESFLGGGQQNTVSGMFGVLGGGELNTSSGKLATLGGGIGNNASGEFAMILGGSDNIASGTASFAAGTASDAANTGAFVWSDDVSGATQLKSTVSNQFLARASGGVKFFSNATLTSGVTLAAGSGTWASLSDRAVKTGIAPIDDSAILDRVAAMPISEWSYISERGVRHVGPMAQDFYAAFGIGEDDKHITSIDEDGVALAAIKALHRSNGVALAAIGDLRRENAGLKAQLSDTRREVKQLASEVAAMRGR